MGLETFDFIDDLNPTFPFGSDDVSEGDDHLRGIKLTLQNAFPSNDGPGSFPGMDFFIRDMDARTITVHEQIQSNPQVSIASITIDGTNGAILGANFGVAASVRIGPGDYELLLEEDQWGHINDLQVALDVSMEIAIGAGVLAPPIVNVSPGWIRVATQLNSEPNAGEREDCFTYRIVVFDSGRD